jgi:hypothetical protein
MLGITLTLRRIDPARHMARFYAMDVQPDSFGCIILTKQWGRIGTHGAQGRGVPRHRSPCRSRLAASGRTETAAGVSVRPSQG